MVTIDQVKKIEKGDVVTRFWYTLKNLDAFKELSSTLALKSLSCKLNELCMNNFNKGFDHP